MINHLFTLNFNLYTSGMVYAKESRKKNYLYKQIRQPYIVARSECR